MNKENVQAIIDAPSCCPELKKVATDWMNNNASDEELTEGGSAKFFVRSDGSTEVSDRGRLKDKEIREIQKFIKSNYEETRYRKAEDFHKQG